MSVTTTGLYGSYKDSGIEWLGEIPAGWEVRRIKEFAAITSGTTPASSNRLYYENGEFNWIRTTDLNNGKLTETEHKVTPLAMQECRLQFLPVDSVLVAMYGGFGTIGKNAILKRTSTINQSICAVLPNPNKFDSLYLQYFLHYFRNSWHLFADGARKDPNINQEAVKNLFAIQPPIMEQVLIGQFLDLRTTAIDKNIFLLEQKIKLYQELKKTLISETICRGLNPEAPRKDSGVAWIGEIPAHWKVGRGKDLFREKSQKGYPKEPLLAASQKLGVVLKTMLEQRSMEAQKSFEQFKLVNIGDFVISLRSFEGGIEIAHRRGIISPAYTVFSSEVGIGKEFYKHLLKSEYFIKQLQTMITGIRDGQAVKFIEIQRTVFPIPPIEEQEIIAKYLDSKSTGIHAIIVKIKAQITTLKELRKTLINDVVTGKINVTTSAQ